jgi:hypothetical protein
MTCKINADTTNGLKLESDTSGEIDIQSNGTTSINFSPSQITITDADSNQPRLLLKNTNADSTPPFLDFQKDSSSPADNDVIGKMRFIGDDDGGNTVAYATIVSTSPDVSDGSENGDLRFETTVDGTNAERMRIDSSGNVGIGTSSPSGKLTVSDIGEDNALYVLGGIKQDDGPGNPWYLGKGILGSTGSEFLIGNGSSELLRIEQGGNVGIGTSSPAGKFAVSDGTVTIDVNPTSSLGYLGTRTNHPIAFTVNAVEEMRLEADGDLHVDGDVIAYSTTVSDIALKSDIEMIPNALDKIDEVRGVTFTRHNGQKSAGIIAQELEKVLPEAVREKELKLVDGKKYKTVEYDAIHGLLINCIKELKEEIKELKNAFTK